MSEAVSITEGNATSLGARFFAANCPHAMLPFHRLPATMRDAYERAGSEFLASLTYTERHGLGEALLSSLLTENLKRVADHLDTWARDHTEEATAETWAALHCAREALASAEAAATNKTA